MAFHRNAPQLSGLKRSSRRVTTSDSCLPPSMYSLRFSLKTQKFLIVLALTALVWIVFGQTAHFDWVGYDDHDYVYRSGRVTSGLNFSNIAWAFTHFHAANWHPITTLSHMLDCQLFGVNPGLHHFSSVVIHALAAIAYFLLWTR